MQEHNIITLSPGLMQQFHRLKILGRFNDEQALIHASFDALENELNQQSTFAASHPGQPYMSHPGLSPDDYDT